MSGISNADTFSVIDPSAQTKADHGKAAWTFLNVPPGKSSACHDDKGETYHLSLDEP